MRGRSRAPDDADARRRATSRELPRTRRIVRVGGGARRPTPTASCRLAASGWYRASTACCSRFTPGAVALPPARTTRAHLETDRPPRHCRAVPPSRPTESHVLEPNTDAQARAGLLLPGASTARYTSAMPPPRPPPVPPAAWSTARFAVAVLRPFGRHISASQISSAQMRQVHNSDEITRTGRT